MTLRWAWSVPMRRPWNEWDGYDTVTRGDALHQFDGNGYTYEDLCGAGYYRKFVADGIPFVAWASFGPDVTQEDRDVALNALTLAGDGFLGGSPTVEPRLPTWWQEETGGGWNSRPRRARGTVGNVELSLIALDGGMYVAGTGDFTVPAVPIESCCGPLSIVGPGNLPTPIRFGAVDNKPPGWNCARPMAGLRSRGPSCRCRRAS